VTTTREHDAAEQQGSAGVGRNGVTKPDLGFFRKMIEVSPVGPGETLYVGDRLDNDIIPAARAGLRTALINRGPWAAKLLQRKRAPSARTAGLHS
jgi:FMN phosphatase YigB (HAD superfamily)